ncbi:stage II sporulation protein D [Tissierella creatinophila]|uniref:Amidase enhancer n=1 Tax=Tissierella creatinophila DSM 6911 TaxID=1123403 RepID=A0A1U7M3D4_TISCR|nr:stage II sporulation protein D [Tissierella creatinophila]OLS01833.1 amidase enhancer precursor [Tissierella creatinophila DSM 6911]
MRRFGGYLLVMLLITILIPSVIAKSVDIVSIKSVSEGKRFVKKENGNNKKDETAKSIKKASVPLKIGEKEFEYIKVYNENTKEVKEILLDEYIKGVVAAEMPARFDIEALKAQAVAARTYAINKSLRFEDGHPNHPKAPICTGVHCQAYLSLEDLQKVHGEKWVEDYWDKIGEAVNTTANLVIMYEGEIIEPLYHSTSGGMTEDSVNVFANNSPYLKAVKSPHEEEAPKFKEVKTLTKAEFVKAINSKFPKAKLKENDFLEKIKLVEKTPSGRINKLSINGIIVEGREVRDIFELNSTNFKFLYDKKVGLMEIETHGYGHGVGMSQWGANGMAKNGNTFEQILKHYYSKVEIKKM